MRRRLRGDAGVVRKSEYRAFKVTKRGWFRCRCSDWHCQARVSLRKHPEAYVRQRKCGCGQPLRVDWGRTLGRESRRLVCHCGAAHYPHRKTWCAEYRP